MQYVPTTKFQLKAGGAVEMKSGATFYIDGGSRVDINLPGPAITPITLQYLQRQMKLQYRL